MTDSPGKARRVIGSFAMLIGASLILDAQAWLLGGGLVIAGTAAMICGLFSVTAGRTMEENPRDAPHGAGKDLP